MKRILARTLRVRLTLLYGVLLAVGLAFYAAGTSVYLLHNLRKQQDASLGREIETVEGLITVSPDGEVELRSEEGEAREGGSEQGYLLEIWTAGGKPMYLSDALEGSPLGPAPDAAQKPFDRSPRTYRLRNGTRVRVESRTHQIEGQSILLRLGVSEEPLWDEFWDMVSVLAIGLPVTVLLIGLAGYAVAGQALQPVEEMAQRARKISAESLNERLTVQDPEDELGRLGLAFNETLARLEKSFEQLRRFTADASHELRTPLTAIRSVGEVALQNTGDAAYYRDIIGSMLEEVSRLTRLVESLLTMSRADAGQIQLQRTSIKVLDLAKESAALLEVLAEEKRQTVAVEGDPSLTVRGDRLILRQALINLIDNAVKYSPSGGTIAVRVRANGKDVLIEVRDSGPGIPEEHAGKIFQRFYRIDKARTRAEGGAGLGLSIAEWAVSANGGRIELHSEAGRGCTFILRLPLNTAENPEPNA
ncbi:sensor histidine kinase [Acidipila rosea]|uniref:histidine kinase n=1 Tax=Acidipila rosea TaxID=768535 RepID=A0A4R1LBP1_9BACT|nr:heavy metal sensor histidine kinase [Acidipila rosea]TCK75896.1 heavy metal sensor kinase [Acidipila rosea]